MDFVATEVLVGVDVGSTEIKALVADRHGGTLGFGGHPLTGTFISGAPARRGGSGRAATSRRGHRAVDCAVR
ncbi:hypothetical protein [Saccharopolyspora phatthalungensis]|uniref:Carbohydrate kinase FGGY N-terminal domain-containing protein n=1 Tax=Saccharopolyspora phatthalungensis TaxID=664693 RepID=A0A840Q1U7_9PSEU|nr:hypothetical protein [Saccharopolyspora phatthalungensis]MBB5153977.1 hypothetical protein [Saccharopolyspora phatthalungensis]